MNVQTNRFIKTVSLFTHGATHPKWAVDSLGRLYNDFCVNRGSIATIPVGRLLPPDGTISLVNLVAEDGNMTTEEVVAMAGLVRTLAPSTILEIGTFNGNTTVQLAANSPTDSLVFTLDLPVGSAADPRTEVNDEHYVKSSLRGRPRYLDSVYANKVRQVYGNSMEVDFTEVCGGRKPDLIFIDGGHSYECVRSDTQRALQAIRQGGLVLWHDYTTYWPGVVNFLNELALDIPLFRVAGTTLVGHDTSGHRWAKTASD